MALNKQTLEADILQAFNDASLDDNSTPVERRQLVAQKLANAFDKFVKSGDGKYQGGLAAGSTAVTSAQNAVVIKLS